MKTNVSTSVNLQTLCRVDEMGSRMDIPRGNSRIKLSRYRYLRLHAASSRHACGCSVGFLLSSGFISASVNILWGCCAFPSESRVGSYRFYSSYRFEPVGRRDAGPIRKSHCPVGVGKGFNHCTWRLTQCYQYVPYQ